MQLAIRPKLVRVDGGLERVAAFHGTRFSPIKDQKSAILCAMLKFGRLG